MKPINKKEIVKREETLPTVNTLLELANQTSQEFTTKDLPRAAVRIAHFSSPQVIKENEKHIEGLAPGMIFNTGTGEFWSGEEAEGIIFLPVKYLAKEIEWLPDRQGFVGEHEINDPIAKRVQIEEETNEGKSKKVRVVYHENGTKTLLVNTAVYHGFLFKPDGSSYDEVVIDMTSSQWGTARDWNLFMRKYIIPHPENPKKRINPPIYYNLYRLYTKYKEDSGNSWYLWKFKHFQEFDLSNPEHQKVFGAALKHRTLIEEGRVKVDYSTSSDSEESTPKKPGVF